jgi:hypothetical protein
MRVTGPGAASQAGATKKKGKSQKADGSFGGLLSAGEASAAQGAAGASSLLPVAPIDSLLAVQMVDEHTPKKQAIDRGNRLLDYLDELRHDLLVGHVTAETANKLIKEIKDSRAAITDPELVSLIDDIELRAAVEMAKLGR